MTSRHIAIGFLALAAFLAPIIGGQLMVDLQPIQPGFFPAALAVLSGGSETPILSHWLIGLVIVVAICVAVWHRRVLHLPRGIVLGPICLLAALLMISLLYSDYRAISLIVLCEWLLCLAAFFAATAITGHGLGPKLVIGALIAGCFIVSVIGLRDYGLEKDPNWRIFANWVNPNALAGILVIGLFCALGFTVAWKRIASLATGAGTAFIGAALLLTQSRGGILVGIGVGSLCFLGLCAAMLPNFGARLLAFAKFAACLVAAFALYRACFMAVAMRSSPTGAGAPAMLGRVASSSAPAQEQSSAFRLLLWKGAGAQIRQTPAGTGIGSYRFVSTRTGLVQQTQFAHNSYVQLGVEASPAAPICLILALIAWLYEMLRGARRMPPGEAPLRAGVVAAVAGCAAHNVFDSLLYQFGIGVAFFILLGLGLQMAADGVSPEFIPRPGRAAAALGAIVVVVLLGYLGYARLLASQGLGSYNEARALAQTADQEAVASAAESARDAMVAARDAAPFDGDLWYCGAMTARTSQEQLDVLRAAVSLTPCPKYERALARTQTAMNMLPDAEISLAKALMDDPNNLPALLQLVRLFDQAGEYAKAEETAKRLVGVESKPYLRLRAIPEVVPTETFEARVYLADRERDPSRRAQWLRPAMDGWLSYVNLTLPGIRENAKAGLPSVSGATLADAKQNLNTALHVATSLESLYRELGRPGDVEAAEAAAKAFSGALGTL